MTTTNNDKTVALNSSDNWETWNLQFQAQAVAGDIWSQIQGLTPFLNKPTAPDPARHKHKTPSQLSVTVRGTSVSVADDEEASPASIPITIADLTTDGFKTYQMEWTIYQANLKDYTQQFDRIERLKQWVLKTVSTHYQRTSCKPTKSILDWYNALQTQAGISDDEAIEDAREAYQLAIKPLTRLPKDLIKWSEQWENALSTAQDKGVPEATRLRSWFNDFIKAVQPILGNWVTAYELVQQTKIKQLTLTYREVAHDFRKEARRLANARVPVGNRVGKGSFGPSFAAITRGKEAYQEDASDSEIVSDGDEGEQKGQKRKRVGSDGKRPKKKQEASGTASTICPACDQFHRLARCFYAFPNLAPESFVEREHIRNRVNNALKDPQLQEKIKEIQLQKQS
ncbi:hypothetical protein B0T26DRAFT_633254 [Lasiosphaeria miniovina]|uniref:Gag protein n=1 Tax=Lasiosphaeria miniovina TaxID=1954250 RepID=A0AA40BI77_9PEZI|nr:uncharacterized protein B0T26DRAFT_633254 [Lasiosphaeria miniovina]KAK0734713.1 hypothetical protein B0T26DRAFT_633254 [Lasiosphaeria miniovina]